jgi:hypothetical protein
MLAVAASHDVDPLSPCPAAQPGGAGAARLAQGAGRAAEAGGWSAGRLACSSILA